MSRLATMIAVSLIVGVSPSFAASCSAVSPTFVASELNAHRASTKLLKKAHLKSLTAYDLFYRCKGDKSKGETEVISFSRYVGDQERHVEYVTIVFYEFPDVETRDLRTRNSGWPDTVAPNSDDIDVFYYLPPGSVEAIRLERLIGYALG